MHAPLVMSLIGKDRPGLMETVANLVADHGANWLESRMCRLGGEFAGILRLQVAGDQRAGLEEALRGLEQQGLTVSLRPDSGGAEPSGTDVHGRRERQRPAVHLRPLPADALATWLQTSPWGEARVQSRQFATVQP